MAICGPSLPNYRGGPLQRGRLSQDRQTLDDQVDIGLYFSALSGLSDRDDGTAALDIYDVNNRDTTLSAAKSLIDGFVADIENGVDDGVLLLRVVGVIDDPFAVA